MNKESKSKSLVLWFDEIGISDVPLVGGKNASLGEMYQNLTKKGVNVPDGFAVTAYAYEYTLKSTNAQDKIKKILKGLKTKDIKNLQDTGREIRELIKNIELPSTLYYEISHAYRKLQKKYGKDCDVAVRSSATAEDLPDASFAGQQETYLNIKGINNLINACKKCFASLFTNRAISYREDKGFNHFDVKLSIGIQKMVRSDLASSGVMFSIDTESGFKDAALITGAYGLGENVVQGAVNPDEYYVYKPTLKKGFKPIIKKSVGEKKIKMVYTNDGNKPVKNVPVPEVDRKKFVLTDDEILKLAEWACIIEDHYTKKHDKYTPMDMEWAKDGTSGKLYIVQARPETVASQKDVAVLESYSLKKKGKVITHGKSVGSRIGAGKAHIIKSVKDIHKFKKGEVLVTDMTDPDWEPIMKIASAIVTNRGGRTCHAAIISRELGIPCVVGTNNGTELIKDKRKITVSCAEGEDGFIYDGQLPFKITKTNLNSIPPTHTKIMMNVGNPDEAFTLSHIPNDGV
ncbi:phosphoenolpyruvate synthase, partial [Candidatus Woesearchaeota archaeon]|nr:phosphoenolpyruvate synthase [Candidatus Woesearchaeota archaeon]